MVDPFLSANIIKTLAKNDQKTELVKDHEVLPKQKATKEMQLLITEEPVTF